MTQPINTFQDIVAALEREPELRKQLRRHILTEDLLNLPAVVGLLEPDEPPLIEQVRNLNGRLDNLAGVVGQPEPGDPPLTQQVRSISRRLGNVAGGRYEERAAHRVVARMRTLGIERARIVLAPGESRPEFHDAMETAVEQGLVSQEELADLVRADIILRGASHHHAVIEASLGPEAEYLEWAQRWAAILAQATGDETVAVVAVPESTEELRAHAH